MIHGTTGPHPAALLLAGAWATGCGMVVMHRAGLPTGLLLMQVAALATAVLMALTGAGLRRLAAPHGLGLALCVLLAASLLLPWLLGGGAQSRWLALGAFRLHLAPVVLPPLLVLLAHATAHKTPGAAWAVPGTLLLAGVALAMQPDPAQLLAFTLAAGVVCWPLRPHRGLAALALALAAGLNLLAWRRQTPLDPVPHVEGILHMAWTQGPALFGLAVLGAGAVLATLLGLRRRDAGSAALYFATLYALAPLQITPVPLVGWGAGPLLGFGAMLMALMATRADAAAPRRSA